MKNKKTFVELLTFGIITFLLGATFVYAQISQTHVISGGVYPGAPTYTVWTDGSGNYYAKNSYGVFSYTNTNITALFDELLNDNPSNLTVNVMPGTYTFSRGFHIDMQGGESNFKLIGEPGAIFASSAALTNLVWSCFIEVYSGEHITIKGITFEDASHGTDYGIVLGGYTSSNHTLIGECQFLNFIDAGTTYLGIAVFGGANSLYDAIVQNCYFENCEQGIVFQPTVGNVISNAVISNNLFVGCGHSINCEASNGNHEGLIIYGNVFRGSTLYSRGLTEAKTYVNVYGTASSYGVSITGNSIIALDGENSTGIKANRLAECSISGNSIKNAQYNETATYSQTGAIVIRGVLHGSITGNSIYNSTIGINLMQQTEDPDFATVTGNTINYPSDYGIFLYRSSNCTITGNTVNNAGRWGIFDAYAGETMNCLITSCVAFGTTGGIYVANAVNNPVNLCWNGTTWIP